MNKIFTTLALLIALISMVKSQTKYDTIVNYITKTPVVIDGQANEACWTNAEWQAIDQVWMPFGATMKAGDFEGKFKVTWDELYLYLLVEVVDDSLSDDHASPTSNWWDDDCLEVFIDENRSMGDHECNNNAFAYHVSLFYDAIDLSPSCSGINYKEHVTVKMDTIGENTYLWEMAFKIYDDSYTTTNTETSRVTLTPNKLMGLTVAYCDNDETTGRENFIGSMQMTAGTNNEMYRNANYFGPMKLIDADYVALKENPKTSSNNVNVYPNPAKSQLTIQMTMNNSDLNIYTLTSITGQVIKSDSFQGNSKTFSIEELNSGIYFLAVKSGNNTFSKIIVKE